MEFINPPPFGAVGDVSKNPTYVIGSVVEVSWTPGEEGKQTSLTLWQLNATTGEYFGSMQYITRKVVDVSTFTWIVATTKDLSVSNMFFLSIFEEGKSSADANSHYFNLTANSNIRPTAASEGSTSASSITRTAATSTSTTAPVQTTPNPAATSNAPLSETSSGLDSGAKIGIGVAIPAAAVLGAIAGYFILRRRRRMVQPPVAPAYHDDNPYNGMGGGNWEPYSEKRPGLSIPAAYGHSDNPKYYNPAELNVIQEPRRVFELPGS
ncbi:hypothetical protein CHGG_04421 [Chaetomium globosum CBS 148.51]|uniref:Mid2 domain-containing protein n=1 Tax=Chaetomium globosum (strain ATCC 6205 / CBS 148.51 / DSM 1962 / NBRC 6347 / NRRL 1970) TaxID=306901 RepID=Q2H1C5_CHAGB|nr:uncharacterized protein CHGG_04421 [Chaetomium globosum CBS 148.51]EAQ87802.1 hypothetical protein CHGG_04421 [Chaetomium globosum CBS 148.51]